MNLPPDAPIPTPPRSSGDLRPGQSIGGGRYVLKQTLGQGGMGLVWLAYDKRLRESVALKFLPAEISLDAAALEDLRRETLRSRKLSHQNVVRIYDLHEAPNEPAFISMEYVDGPDLHSLRSRRPAKVLSWKFLAPLVRQLCSALDYAHGERIIHRDIKPANLMLASNERIKLADFGLACVIHDSLARISGNPSPVAGTLHYMSPQQANGIKPGVTDDIYALGATLYELLTSRPPFYTGDIAYQVRNTRPQAMQERLLDLELANTIPSEVSALVMACLAKDPAQRPQSAKAILDWLEAAENQPAKPVQEPRRIPSGHAGEAGSLQNHQRLPASAASVEHAPAPAPSSSRASEEDLTPASEPHLEEPSPGTSRLALAAIIFLAIAGWTWFKNRPEPPREANVSGAATVPGTPAPSTGAYENLFNGRDLTGWEGDPRIWSVRDNLLVGQATRMVSGNQTNTHLFWRGTLVNFELQLSFKIERGNSGIVYRATRLRDWDAAGYQYPLWLNYSGGLIDSGWDRPRRDLARVNRPQSKLFWDNDWNEATIIAQDNHLIHKLNGVIICNITDTEQSRQLWSGLLALKCRPGEYTDTLVYFKNIRLRRLP